MWLKPIEFCQLYVSWVYRDILSVDVVKCWVMPTCLHNILSSCDLSLLSSDNLN